MGTGELWDIYGSNERALKSEKSQRKCKELSPSSKIRRWIRLVFFCALFKHHVATPEDFAQVLTWIISGGPPSFVRSSCLKETLDYADESIRAMTGRVEIRTSIDAFRETRLGGGEAWLRGSTQAEDKVLVWESSKPLD